MSRIKLFPFMLITMLAFMLISATNTLEEPPRLIIPTEYIEGKGMVLKFEGAENLDPIPLEGEVVIGDTHFAMQCKLKDNDILVCVAFLPKSHYGDLADVYLGPYVYSDLVREPRDEPEPEPIYIPLPPAVVIN